MRQRGTRNWPAFVFLALALSPAARAAELIVLGIAQDAGVPQAGCTGSCCAPAIADPRLAMDPSCLALIDGTQRWLFDASPQFGRQLAQLDVWAPPTAERSNQNPELAGIFLTHAHLGHYAGLLQLGREVMGARDVVVYAMPRMHEFLRTQAPLRQLVELSNIRIESLTAEESVQLDGKLRVTPILVPHRDEFSETVGYWIAGPKHRALYLPDIDKWDRWDRSLAAMIEGVDRAYIDGTFFDASELPGRSMSEVPHPFIVESLALLAELDAEQRAKVHFIHLNHSNPALKTESAARATLEAAGCQIATLGERFEL